jgi:lariat debranching enzyme
MFNFLLKRDEQLDTQEDRQWVRSKLNTRGAKPFDFVQTAPSFNPSNTISKHSTTGKFEYSLVNLISYL